MRVGLLARAEDRGIGIQTWEFYRAMRPDRTLVVEMGELSRGFEPHLDRYPDATVVGFDGISLPEEPVREFLDAVDVVYMVETPYDYRLLEWAREQRTATVVHVNPEFFRWASDPDLPEPSAWWAPSTWRLDALPDSTRYVPVPVATDRFDGVCRGRAETFLHTAGHVAMADRNGTTIVLMALRFLHRPARWVAATQDDRIASVRRLPAGVEVEYRTGGVEDYWRAYDGVDVVVLPRRYGGLCLPAQEAMAAGCVVVMPDASPQRDDWPVELVSARLRQSIRTQAGSIPLVETDVRSLARLCDDLVARPERVQEASARSLAWAELNSWRLLRDLYRSELERVAARP